MRKRPVITSSAEMKIEVRPRPPEDRTLPHKWLTTESRQLFDRSNGSIDLFLSKLAEERIRNHALSKLNERLEVMGLLLGSVYEEDGRKFVLIRDVATTDLDASSVSVKFERDGWEKLFQELEDSCFHYVVVGWYHSHPGHRCFLSETDIDTQVRMFNQPFHIALVIDPVNSEIATFYLKDGRVAERPFAVYWDQYQNPYYGESVKIRKKR
ncbi:MAG: Mov34/MPN/PAD-1 family protein [Methanomassiliicoccales archaeon PtaU1.Bin124]|nr:MAG: Mov34/MPN/PAD-1 family protein [Methanomassiliicoccales archaeon PtaU1.Bin124]